MLKAYKKLVLEKKIDEKIFHLTFDEDAPLGSLFQAVDEMRNFVIDQINSTKSEVEVKKDESQDESTGEKS